jgi:hypothetical protein
VYETVYVLRADSGWIWTQLCTVGLDFDCALWTVDLDLGVASQGWVVAGCDILGCLIQLQDVDYNKKLRLKSEIEDC